MAGVASNVLQNGDNKAHTDTDLVLDHTECCQCPHDATGWGAYDGGSARWIGGGSEDPVMVTCTAFTQPEQRVDPAVVKSRRGSVVGFTENDRLAVIAIPKTGTRSLEKFLMWHLPFIQPAKGCLYCLDGTPAAADPTRWPPSTAMLQPEPGAPGSDLRLIHANVEEALVDYSAHQAAAAGGGVEGGKPNRGDNRSDNAGAADSSGGSGRLFMTTLLRDPFERIMSEFRFGLKFQLRDAWPTPDAWRFQFWGQSDITDDQLRSLQLPAGSSFNGTRLEHFAEHPWVAAHNRQTRFVAGVGDVSVPVTRGMLAQAKRNLDRMDVVGTLDDLAGYFGDLTCVFGSVFDEARSVGPQTAPYDAAIEKDGRLTASGDNKGVKGTSTARFRHAVYKNSWADLELVAYAKQIIKLKRAARQC